MANTHKTKRFTTLTDPFLIYFWLVLLVPCDTTTITDAPPSSIPNKRYQQQKVYNDCTSKTQACAKVVNHVWQPPSAELLCNCPDSYDCPTKWSQKPNGHTITYNGRAQLKFCTNVSTVLSPCNQNEVALVKREMYDKTNRTRTELEAYCHCKPNHYYQFEITSRFPDGSTVETAERFNCKKFGHCRTGEFCAYLTSGTFHPYYVCTCPYKHMCLIRDKKKKHLIKELFYNGTAYRGVCTPTNY